MINRRVLKFVAITLAVLIFIVWWYHNFTMNFGYLGWMFIIAIGLVPFCYHKLCKDDMQLVMEGQSSKIGIYDYVFALICAGVLLALGFGCVFTLNNYFHADSQVYRNIDHHVMRFDGIVIDNPNQFLLAANNRNAFFDDFQMNGQATIVEASDSMVTLSLNNFTRPLFFNDINSDKLCTRQIMVNDSSLISFKAGEHLQLMINNDSIYDFSIQEISNDTVRYLLSLSGGDTIRSDEHRFLTMGLPMPLLTRNPEVQSSDFIGLHIVRNVIDRVVKHDDKLSTYANTRYCLEVQGSRYLLGSYVKQVRVEDGPWRDVSTSEQATIEIPMEQTFVIGYGANATRQAYFTRSHPQAKGHLALVYRLPMYHYFEKAADKDLNHACVATSLSTFMSNIDAMPENILLFDAFAHSDNVNNIRPLMVSYVSGQTDRSLQFVYYLGDREMRARTGESFSGMEAVDNPGVRWLASVENLKDTPPYQASDIILYIIIFTIALALLLCVGAHRVDNEEAAQLNTFTTVEFIAYAITLFLVTFRWFLLWRTSVFVPDESISYYELEGIFRKSENGEWLIRFMIGFVILLLVAKLIIRYKALNWSLPQKWLYRLAIVWLIAVLVVCSFIKKPWFIITAPVLTYLINSVVITSYFSDHYKISDRKFTELRLSDNPAKLFFFSLINALVTSAALLYIDSGFGILFFTFTLFWLSWLLHEHVTHYLADSVGINRRNWLVLVVFIVMLLLVWLYKDIIGLMYYRPIVGSVIMAVAGAFVGFSVLYILDWGKRPMEVWLLSILTILVGLSVGILGGMYYSSFPIGCVLFFMSTIASFGICKWICRTVPFIWIYLMAIVFACASFGFHFYVSESAKHTVQRIVVQFEKPEDAMKNIGNAQNENRFLQAALNHMIIGEYSRRGDDVVLLGENGEGYFKMQPHSKVGAMWSAQLTDISLVRFVIAEHSPKLPLLIVGFFLLMIVWAARQPLYHRWTRALLLQIPLLLMVQSLLIWMATTRRFIFLGQDFPMISINSRLTLVYYFSLIMIWVAVAIYSKVTYTEVYNPVLNKEINYGDNLRLNKFRYTIARREMWMLAIIMSLCMLFAYIAPRGIDYSTQDTQDGTNIKEQTFSLKGLMDDLSKTINNVNERLREFQYIHYPQGWPKNKSLADVSDFIKEFNDSEHIDSLFVNSSFGMHLWRNFVDLDSRNNNTHNVIYAYLKNEVDTVLRVHRVLNLFVTNYFYDQELPPTKDKFWKGNIVETSGNNNITTNIIRTPNLWATRLPDNWMADGVERTIVSSIGSRVVGSEGNFKMRKGINSTIVMGPGINIDNQEISGQLRNIMTAKRYLARNVMLNGRRAMFYPMGASLYWMRSFADELMRQRKKIPIEKRSDDFDCDVELTLLPDMNKDLEGILRESGTDHCSVIVANGDGEVWAMPSYNKGFQLNPNDSKQVFRMSDSLSLYGAWGSADARYAFGNQNLMNMPFGPGSSQKPLVWTAVAAKVNYKDWKQLQIQPYKEWVSKEGNKYVIKQFNGMRFMRNYPFRPLLSDEQQGGAVTLRGYMTHSSNVYNALMAYIGSFNEDELASPRFFDISNDRDGQSLFAWSHDSVRRRKNAYLERFPLLSLGKREEFTLNKRLPISDQANSLLNHSMNEMFFRNLTSDGQEDRYMISNPANGVLKIDSTSRGFAYVELSHFDMRHGRDEEEFMENAIRFTAIGGAKVWYVTPWKMAEAYGRMASLNSNLHLSVLKRRPMPYSKFANLSYGYLKARPEQLKGMSDVITIGTAKVVGSELSVQGGKKDASNSYNGYYIYAKTGTIGPEKRGVNNHHRFGVILSNVDLMTANIDHLADARYVILYFTFSHTGQWKTYAKVIRAVVESPMFRNYMNNNQH